MDNSFSQNQELMQAYNACVSSTDPQLKDEACRRYEELSKYTPDSNRTGYADGGDVGDSVSLVDEPMEESPETGDATAILERAHEALDEEEYSEFESILQQIPDLASIIDKILMSVEEFEGEGEVEGPGTETSDSIPAKLSDGEFVFTAKAVKQIGADKLYKMMKKAEKSFDAAQKESGADQEFAVGGLIQRKCK